jgi:hypothetical protein
LIVLCVGAKHEIWFEAPFSIVQYIFECGLCCERLQMDVIILVAFTSGKLHGRLCKRAINW